MKNFKSLKYAASVLFDVLWKNAPGMVALVAFCALAQGALGFLAIWVNAAIFESAASIALERRPISSLLPYLALLVAVTLAPPILGSVLVNAYAEPKTTLILRTKMIGKLLEKLKRMKYEHLESRESMEIIDKAFNRTVNAGRHLFPYYFHENLYSLVFSLGALALFASVRWWLVLTILIPFAIESWLASRANYDIYGEMEKYWARDREYSAIGEMLSERDFVRENRLYQNSPFLIHSYKERMRARNKDYEKYFFGYFKRQFSGASLTRLTQIGNAFLILFLFVNGQVGIGMAISLTLALFGTLLAPFSGLSGAMLIWQWSGTQTYAFDYYRDFFALSERESGEASTEAQQDFSIEFDDLWFKYPGSEKDALKGVSIKIPQGKRAALVGENGGGKTTLVKLLLGLFEPDKGEIRIGGKPLRLFSQAEREKMFGAVFQDFNKYNMTLRENIAIGALESLREDERLERARDSVRLDLPLDALLGKEFEGGADLSGGEWQRLCIARALVGARPIMILDEPSSQLDPIAESRLYSEFAALSAGRTTLFVTHRLGSTAVMDNIVVIANGEVAESGAHEELLQSGGIYAKMYAAQKKWYEGKNGSE
ncbi:MAG: ABC transporter ATP-binding protein/permease [Treponema sp.]|nr:ABC transporter ATP-binding protein/permease [Treponema sp.]